MRDGIHVNPWVVRIAALLLLAALGMALKTELPAARRYLKIETM
jgi:hypothetical protein